MTASTKSLELMIGGLLEATANMQRDITEIRRDIKESDARAALSYEQSEQRAATSRAKLHTRTDELIERMGEAEAGIRELRDDLTNVKAVTDEVTRWKLMGMGALAVTGVAFASLGSLVTYYWSDLWRALRGV
jgi:hypothetical protein